LGSPARDAGATLFEIADCDVNRAASTPGPAASSSQTSRGSQSLSPVLAAVEQVVCREDAVSTDVLDELRGGLEGLDRQARCPPSSPSSSISRVEPSDISEEEGDCAGREGRHARMMRECGRCYKA